MNKTEILVQVREYWEDSRQTKNFIPGKSIVPVSGAVIDADDIVSVVGTVLDGWFTEWAVSNKFSNELAKYVGMRHALLCNSGSSALLLAISACVEKYNGKGKKIVTCATGFPTTIAPIIQCGCIPLFVDVDPKTLNPRPEDILACLERDDVVGVVQAHTLGLPFNAFEIMKYCILNDKFFVEDCSDALGGAYNSNALFNVGRYGSISTFSFFPAHHITTGEGGAICTDNDELAEIIRSYRDWGRSCFCKPGQTNTCGKRFEQQFGSLPFGYDHKYVFERIGYNLKMTEMQAALGYSQLKKIDKFVNKRRENYIKLFIGLSPLIGNGIIDVPELRLASPFGFPITRHINPSKDLIAFLEGRKIYTRPVFAGNITRHPMMNGVRWESDGTLIGSDYVMDHTFWVGCHPGMTDEMLDWVIESVHEYFIGK